MAPRFSAPSASVGINRFHVWPLGGDSYAHTDLASNWDTSDGILGAPSSGVAWPPTTGLDGGIYREIQLLILERSMIGSFMFWFRPNTNVPLSIYTSRGWALADGSVLGPSAHSFPGGGSITLPNMLNATPIGADPTKNIGQAADVVSSANVNNFRGAPGVGATGGQNAATITEAQMPPHNHGGVTNTVGFNNSASNAYNGVGPVSNCMLGVGGNALDGEQGNHNHTVASDGGGQPIDNRPNWVGLIPIIKVLFVSSIS